MSKEIITNTAIMMNKKPRKKLFTFEMDFQQDAVLMLSMGDFETN